MYRALGAGWHLTVDIAEISHVYGDPNYNNWGRVQVAESGAEYIGTDNGLRRYGNGTKTSKMLSTNLNPFVRFDDALEREDWFAEPRQWIPSGVYFDLIDNTVNLNEDWDQVGGSNIQQLYNVFRSQYAINNICDFRDVFILTNPQYDQGRVRTLFNHYNTFCK